MAYKNWLLVLGLAFLVLTGRLCFAANDLEFGGEVRARLRYVDSKNEGPLRSTYGEELMRGFSLHHRFTFEVVYLITPSLRAGGLIRVSNEGEEVLRAGPEYFSSEFGSAFLSYETPSLRSRLGYYSITYTPLTLMRWDLKDDAEAASGCMVCAGAAGTSNRILGESLEELGPDLTFEGFRIEATPSKSFGADFFFARPRVAGPVEFQTFRQIIAFGAKATASKYLTRTGLFLTLGLIATRTKEDDRSVEGVDYPPAFPQEPFKYTVFGLTWEIPIVKGISLSGEITRTKHENRPDPDPEKGIVLSDGQGKGSIANLDMKFGSVVLEAAYIYLSPEWDSYFKALSYSPDRRGPRLRFTLERQNLLLSIFARYLISINSRPQLEDNKEAFPTLSAVVSYKPLPELTVSGSATYTGSGAHEGTLDFKESGRLLSLVAALVYDLGKGSSITLEDRFLDNQGQETDIPGSNPNYEAHNVSLYAKVPIW